MKLTNVLQRFSKPLREKSMLQVLEQLVGSGDFQKILALTPDRRELLSAVAKQLGLSEDSVVEHLANQLAVPFLRSVSDFDPLILPNAFCLADLEKIGCAPIFSRASLRAFACVDPFLARAVDRRLADYPLYMATWRQIKKAIIATKAITQKSKDQLQSTARNVLRQIVEEAMSYKAFSVSIQQDVSGLLYSFHTTDGRRANGKISPKIAEQIKDLLFSLKSGDKHLLSTDESILTVESVNFSLQSFGVSFRWSKAAQIAKSQVEEFSSLLSNVVPFPNQQYDHSHSARKPKVLVVEDNATFALVMERFLSRSNLDVVVQSSAEQALALLNHEQSIDLVICDVHMPGMGGLAFLTNIKASAAFKNLAVIMLTSDSDSELHLNLLQSGADVFLNKNEDPRILAAHVKKIIDRISKRQAA